ncbi:glucokinase [Modicella reniformis]|uniref:Phosphotransferase n=1 Tax=Modicella reniformis TaxID=1440133 RepID=A0A9P6MLZ1_9FUNG|nr:glucokinase [Modicella reniformis]
MNFIAEEIQGFIDRIKVHEKTVEHWGESDTLELGFTFSFPVAQTAIDSGTLIHWTKDYECSGAQGNDIVKLLQDGLERKKVNVHVAALINDTVGTLLAHSYSNRGTYISAILGTGTNGAYVEDTSNIEGIDKSSKEMLINIEWGNFSNCRKCLPVSDDFDDPVDNGSPNPGIHRFEKMISGMYLGEITRNVLVYLIRERVLFDGNKSAEMNKQWAFKTEFMSKIEEDDDELTSTKGVLKELGISSSRRQDQEIVKFVCKLVGERAASLSAMAIAAVIRQCLEKGSLRGHNYPLKLFAGDKTVDPNGSMMDIQVGIDGSVFEHYPNFKENMEKGLVELLGERAKNIVKLTAEKYDMNFLHFFSPHIEEWIGTNMFFVGVQTRDGSSVGSTGSTDGHKTLP